MKLRNQKILPSVETSAENTDSTMNSDTKEAQGGHHSSSDHESEQENFEGYDESQMDAGQVQIMKFLQSLNSQMKTLNSKVTKIEEKVTTIEAIFPKVVDLEKKVEHNSVQIDRCRNEVRDLQHKYDTLLERHLAFESYSRRENLLFHGVTYDADENCATKIRTLMKTQMNIAADVAENVKFHRCHRIGGKSPNSPIICRFAFYEDRCAVWEKRFSLKKSKIFVTENFAPEIEERRKRLYPVFKAAKARGMKATMRYDKVIVESVEYSVATLDTLPPELVPASVGTETRNNVTCFFTASSPLSNFHVIDDGILIDGDEFDCVGRYYQMCKALFAERPADAQKIKAAKTPLQCKKIGDSVKVNENQWFPRAQEVMLCACSAKFDQHLPSREFLLNTGNSELAEAGPCKTWGIGLRMTNPDAFNKDNWQGMNTLGKIIMKVRKDLKH